MQVIMKLVFLKVSLSYFARKVKKCLKWNEKQTLFAHHVVLFKYFVDHVLQTNGIVYSSEREAIK